MKVVSSIVVNMTNYWTTNRVFDRSPLGTTNPIWKLVSLLVGTGISINKSRLPHHRVDQNATASLRTWLIWVLSPPPPLYPSGLLVMFMPHDLFFICRHIFFPFWDHSHSPYL